MPLPHLWKEAFTDVERWAGAAHMRSLLLDFDGALTPLQPAPDSVFIDSSVRRVLTEIQDTGRIAVGIISGRSLEEIQGLVGICGIVYAGNHGMEILGSGVRFIDRAALAARDEVQLLELRFKYELKDIENVHIRNTGLSITIHWSTPLVPEVHQQIRNVVIDAVADGGRRFTVRDAANSIAILPSTNWNKGLAAHWINKHLGVDNRNSMYVGDDGADEDVFVKLNEAITVKVGANDDTRAHYRLSDSAEVLTLLKLLLVLSRKQ